MPQSTINKIISLIGWFAVGYGLAEIVKLCLR